jgi:hypothetical protein
MPTLARAYALARSGQYENIERLKARLNADGYRAVDALLAPRSVRGHLTAICAATYRAEAAAAEPAAEPQDQAATAYPPAG